MKAENINSKQFKKAIEVSFENDPHIFKLYNPNVQVASVEDIVNDISDRINSDVAGAAIKGVYEKNILIGYYVFDSKTLVSFGLNIAYRNRKYLKNFWQLIRKDLRGGFQVFLWTRNIRGWKWLQKNNMKIVQQDDLLTHLIF